MKIIEKIREMLGLFIIGLALIVMPKQMEEVFTKAIDMGLDIQNKAYTEALKQIEETKK